MVRDYRFEYYGWRFITGRTATAAFDPSISLAHAAPECSRNCHERLSCHCP